MDKYPSTAQAAAGLRHWGAGIFSVDSGYLRPEFDAIHLIVETDRAAIVDSGTVHSVPRVLAALDALGIAPAQVDWILLTHVHLDHAGGAGALMRACPNAKLTVHPRGARHMIDPSRLWQATVDVYGQAEAEAFYGEIVPVPAGRVVETGEGASLSLAGRELQFIDTPGHARHHVVIRDSATGRLFTGDMFGISYRELDVAGRPFIIPSSSPAQFDPDDTLNSIDRILALAPEAVYLTHYAERRNVAELGARLKHLVRRYVAIAEDALASEAASAGRPADSAAIADLAPALRQRIGTGLARLYLDELAALGSPLDPSAACALLRIDIDLNADGLIAWMDGRARRQPVASGGH